LLWFCKVVKLFPKVNNNKPATGERLPARPQDPRSKTTQFREAEARPQD